MSNDIFKFVQINMKHLLYKCKFGQNPPTGSEDNARKRSYADVDADGIRTKNNISPPPPPPPSVRGHNFVLLDFIDRSITTAISGINVIHLSLKKC